MKNIRNLVMGIGLGASTLAFNGCETPSPVEMAMFGPGGIERLSAQGYYQMANDPSLTHGQREGALVMGNILDNQANYAQGTAIAREGRDQIVIVNGPGKNQHLKDIPYQIHNGIFDHVKYENNIKYYVYKTPSGMMAYPEENIKKYMQTGDKKFVTFDLGSARLAK